MTLEYGQLRRRSWIFRGVHVGSLSHNWFHIAEYLHGFISWKPLAFGNYSGSSTGLVHMTARNGSERCCTRMFYTLVANGALPGHVQALLPDEQMLSLESIREGESCVLVYATTLDKRARCPVCNRISRSIPSIPPIWRLIKWAFPGPPFN